jgi:hypothetical protein
LIHSFIHLLKSPEAILNIATSSLKGKEAAKRRMIQAPAWILYFRNNNGFGFADRFTGSASQAVLRPHRNGLVGHFEDVHRTKFHTLLAAVAPIRIHVNEIEFDADELFSHKWSPSREAEKAASCVAPTAGFTRYTPAPTKYGIQGTPRERGLSRHAAS